MKIPFKPIPISVFIAISVAIFLFLLFIFGRIAYQEISDLDKKFHQAAESRAKDEIERALKNTVAHIEQQTRLLAEWKEIGQQLSNPSLYSYWYRHRAKTDNYISEYTIDIGIYGPDGRMLTDIDTALLPLQMAGLPAKEYIQLNQSEPMLILFAPINDPVTQEVSGHVATMSRIMPHLLSRGQFSQVDPDSLSIDVASHQRVVPEQLMQHIHYRLTNDTYANTLRNVMTDSVLRLGSMAAILSLIIFPLAARIMSRPIRQIAQHVDLLKKHAREPITSSFQQPLLIRELDKIRQSLNAYHNALNNVSLTLDEKTRELRDLTQHDPLTGAMNRSAFDTYWQEIGDVFRHGRGQICLILFDINHFKAINDSYGHEVGDEALAAVSQIIKNALQSREQVFRLGGDEFACILIGSPPRKAIQVAKQIHLGVCRYPFDKLGINEPVRLSMGIAHAKPANAGNLASLQWRANVAIYHAKRPGQGNIVLFSEEMAESTRGLYSNLTHSAVYSAVSEGKGLVMYYQPIVDLQTGSPHYYEALVRISHAGQLIMPSHIFPLVEAKGLEVDLDQAVFAKILYDLERRLVPPGTGISINISAPTIVESDLFDWLELFEPYMGDYKILLEITETALITQMQTARANLSHLQSRGFRIALDDFGSGYSSLRYLGSMPVDVVKFDISLTRLLDAQTQSPILSHLAQMILECGHLLVAEGIETTTSSTKQLTKLGFRYGQGYFFGKPAPAVDLMPAYWERTNFSA